MLGIIGGVLALALIATAVVVFLRLRGGPQDAVEQYFEAIRAGDAQTALSFVSVEPANRDLLTDEVLRRSNELAPITEVRVVDASRSSVEVELTIGGTSERVDYRVEREDGWQLSGGVFQPSFTLADEGAPMLVNGVAVDPRSVWLFPGTYEFTTGSDHLSWGPESTLTLLGGRVQTPTSLSLQVEQSGEEAARAAINESMAACAAQQSLQPADCPFQQEPPSDVVVEESTISWELEDPASGWVPQAVTDGTQLTGDMSYQVRLRYSYTVDGETESYDQPASLLVRVTVDLIEDPILVVYGR